MRINIPSFIVLLIFMMTSGCSEGEKELTNSPMLKLEDTRIGKGSEARDGQLVTVHYTGWLYDENRPDNKGPKFDSSLDRNESFQFQVGAGQVIAGWDEGVPGMKVGGTRELTIPPDLGYGSREMGVIPPNSTLIFEVQLLDVQ
tara:strand:+ start:602 stop:1033 length:432 start_codon:yes stop_codon:yes gene_type:complete